MEQQPTPPIEGTEDPKVKEFWGLKPEEREFWGLKPKEDESIEYSYFLQQGEKEIDIKRKNKTIQEAGRIEDRIDVEMSQIYCFHKEYTEHDRGWERDGVILGHVMDEILSRKKFIGELREHLRVLVNQERTKAEDKIRNIKTVIVGKKEAIENIREDNKGLYDKCLPEVVICAKKHDIGILEREIYKLENEAFDISHECSLVSEETQHITNPILYYHEPWDVDSLRRIFERINENPDPKDDNIINFGVFSNVFYPTDYIERELKYILSEADESEIMELLDEINCTRERYEDFFSTPSAARRAINMTETAISHKLKDIRQQ